MGKTKSTATATKNQQMHLSNLPKKWAAMKSQQLQNQNKKQQKLAAMKNRQLLNQNEKQPKLGVMKKLLKHPLRKKKPLKLEAVKTMLLLKLPAKDRIIKEITEI